MAGRARWAFGTLLQMGDGGEEPVVGGGSTTTDAATAADDTVIPVVATANFTAGDLVLIGGAGGEIGEVASVVLDDTITLVDGLQDGWPTGTTVVEVEPESFTTLAEVKDIDGPEASLDTEDVTPHDAIGGWEEIIPTILRSGEVTFDLNYVPGLLTHEDLRARMKARQLSNFQLLLPTQPQYAWPFSAYVTRMGNAFPVGGAMNQGVTMKITGELADPAVVV